MRRSCLPCLVLAAKLSALDVPAPLPPGAWELPASLRDNECRGDVVLNGFWLCRTAPEDPWKPVRVPDTFLSGAPREFRRQLVLPEAWRGRALELEVGRAAGTVTVNGVEVGTATGRRFETLSLGATTSDAVEITIASRGILEDVWLRSRPEATVGIEESFLQASWRKKELCLTVRGVAGPGQQAVVRAALENRAKGDRLVFPEARVEADAQGGWAVLLRTPWDPAVFAPWNRSSPALHQYTVELADADGRMIDRLLPRRVGLRETWIEDGRFMLNGYPVSIVDDVWEGGVDRGNSCRPQAEKAIALVKSMGINGAIRLSSEVGLEVADELGLLVQVGCGSMVRFNIWDPKSGLTDMRGDETQEDIERVIRRLREHPSILDWFSAAPYSLASMHPQYAGQYYNAWEFFPLNRFSKTGREGQDIFRQCRDMMRALDPSREVANHNGPYSPIEIATRYLCDDLDLQEREEFFDHWFRSGPNRKAIWIAEFGTPIAGHQFLRRVDFQLPQGPAHPKIHLENLARWIGESAYRMEDDANFANWLKDNFYPMMRYPAMQLQTALNVPRYWKAWRTYGVNASAHHVLGENCMGPVAKSNATAQVRYGFETLDDPRVPGFSRCVSPTAVPNPVIDGTPPAAAAYFASTQPLLGYIGGSDTHFTRKDHLYTAGAPVRKAYIVVNDRDEAVPLKGRWELVDRDGKTIAEGPLDGTVGPGGRALTEFPIEFPAPSVEARTDFTLRVRFPAQPRATLDDAFAITVFPATPPQPLPTFSGTVWTLNISDDLTHESPHFFINRDNQALLAATGLDARLVKGLRTFTYEGYAPDAAEAYHQTVKRKGRTDIPKRELVTEGAPGPGDLLVIPRHTLSHGTDSRQLNLRLLERLGLDRLVEQGLRVLVLEQALDNVMGLNTEQTRPRQVFIAAKGHPVFEGLQDSDLAQWTGESDLEGAITPHGPSDNRFPERLWKVSNTGSVATRTFVRPQVGACRALAVCGFDLQETPLLEVVRGKGRILFCQFDVSNRYGKDPAATRLLDNLLRYMMTVAEPDPAQGDVAVVAAGTGGVTTQPGVFRGAVPEGPDGWGLTQGDFFIRESIYVRNSVTRTLPAVQWPIFPGKDAHGYPAMVRRSGERLETTLDPTLFETGWMRRKAAWVHSALSINQGGSRLDGPALSHQGRLTDLYPHEWVEDFVHPYTTNIW